MAHWANVATGIDHRKIVVVRVQYHEGGVVIVRERLIEDGVFAIFVLPRGHHHSGDNALDIVAGVQTRDSI